MSTMEPEEANAALRSLQAAARAGELADPRAGVAYVALQLLELGARELNGPVRRAVLLVAAGGDPSRSLELDGRAVRALAQELASPERCAELAGILSRLRESASALGLDDVAAAVSALQLDSDLAWRLVAAGALADELDPG
jgi:hypothetical protein